MKEIPMGKDVTSRTSVRKLYKNVNLTFYLAVLTIESPLYTIPILYVWLIVYTTDPDIPLFAHIVNLVPGIF